MKDPVVYYSEFPGVGYLRTYPESDDEIMRRVILRGGERVGDIIYRRRKLRSSGSLYGWQLARAPRNSALTTQADAVRKLLDT